MESNGKSVDRDGYNIDYDTAPQIYGEVGTDCQHSYMQMIHQGSNIVPVDFIHITDEDSKNQFKDHYQMLMANMKGQADALAIGQNSDEAKHDPFRVFQGNRPSTIFHLKTFDFKTIGYFIAAYEHKIFTQGILWNLNSFDQPGVELGKSIALKELQSHGT
jgi:glucose-6-phosphate isomerase